MATKHTPNIWQRNYDTFGLVAALYDEIKPINSPSHPPPYEVRPLGKRGRKHERIVKVNDNSYALLDGMIGLSIHYTPTPDVLLDYELSMAPILWKRRADGDYVRIRNMPIDQMTFGRAKFFGYALPSGLEFVANNGRHEIVAKESDSQNPRWYTARHYPLPKSARRFDFNKMEASPDDGNLLWFKQTDLGRWTRVGESLTVRTTRIDTEEKAKWKPTVEAFYTWTCAMMPIIDLRGKLDAYREYRDQMFKCVLAVAGSNAVPSYWGMRATTVPESIAREILIDSEHDLRIAFAALVIYESGLDTPMRTPDDIRNARARFNRVMNKTLGLFKTVEV
jgi:hypothetical protein